MQQTLLQFSLFFKLCEINMKVFVLMVVKTISQLIEICEAGT